MKQHPRPGALALLTLSLAASCAPEPPQGASPGRDGGERPAPVEVAEIETGALTERRVFTGTLEASAEVLVAPRIAGNVERLTVDIGDAVENGQVIAWIDDDELVQSVAQAEADRAVGKATLEEAEASAELATRTLQRQAQLRKEGIASAAELDTAAAAEAASRAKVAVARARVLRVEAALETARVRLGRTRIVAEWGDVAPRPTVADGPPLVASPPRYVAERRVDVGSVVNSSTTMLSLVALDPIVAVVFVPERDFSRLAVDQRASFSTDAYSGESFEGRIARIAPVFRRSTRQVRVELEVSNGDLRLRPGMFVRATLELAHEPSATIVPVSALLTREEVEGVFVLPPGAKTVRWCPVRRGLRENDRVQVFGDGLSGAVVILGQELCDDGSTVAVFPAEAATSTPR
ncbi:MAG: efflux RND transporter periplasmic adaptor subunit [Planctomycetota bacterium]|nr:efflux RND transporter periplasmic adaptor subunit [Planctomycetota bacterium]